MATPEHPTGYVADTSYPDRFHRELSPAWLNYVASVTGGAAPRRIDEPFSYLDLGSGLTRSTIVNAAAFPQAEFHACDFNPTHIQTAERYQARLGIANLRLHQARFEELLDQDLPRFDFIVLHGVYSWVDSAARAAIRRIIARRLKDGGIVYVSYNCLPGWSAEAPLRKLLVELARTEDGSHDQRAKNAAGVLRRFAGGGFKYAQENPSVNDAIKSIAEASGDYLAHEYLNDTWALYYSVDVADDMADAGLRYVGSASLPHNHPVLTLDKRAAEVIAGLPGPRLQQLVADYACNQRFRRDVFVSVGAPRPDPRSAADTLDRFVVGCADEPDQIAAEVAIPRGKISFNDDFIRALRSVMADGPASLGEIARHLGGQGRSVVEIKQNLIFLVASGALMPFAKTLPNARAPRLARIASETVERALELIIETDAAAVVPCACAGNGVPISVAEARAALDWRDGTGPAGAGPPARLVRLGLISRPSRDRSFQL